LGRDRKKKDLKDVSNSRESRERFKRGIRRVGSREE